MRGSQGKCHQLTEALNTMFKKIIDSKCFLAGPAKVQAMMKIFNAPNSKRTFRTTIPLCPPSPPQISSLGRTSLSLDVFAIFEGVLCIFGSEFPSKDRESRRINGVLVKG